jgi:hypothetical protein
MYHHQALISGGATGAPADEKRINSGLKISLNPCISRHVEDNNPFVNGAGKHIDMRS